MTRNALQTHSTCDIDSPAKDCSWDISNDNWSRRVVERRWKFWNVFTTKKKQLYNGELWTSHWLISTVSLSKGRLHRCTEFSLGHDGRSMCLFIALNPLHGHFKS